MPGSGLPRQKTILLLSGEKATSMALRTRRPLTLAILLLVRDWDRCPGGPRFADHQEL